MRYKVRFGGPDQYSIVYAGNQADAAVEFQRYHPNIAVTGVEEYPEEQTVDLYDLIEETDAEETIRYLIEAIEEAGATDRVAGYLRRHGFG